MAIVKSKGTDTCVRLSCKEGSQWWLPDSPYSILCSRGCLLSYTSPQARQCKIGKKGWRDKWFLFCFFFLSRRPIIQTSLPVTIYPIVIALIYSARDWIYSCSKCPFLLVLLGSNCYHMSAALSTRQISTFHFPIACEQAESRGPAN